MNAEQIRHVLVVGAGTMGQQIALVCAWHGYQVMLYDMTSEILERSLARIRELTQTVVAEGLLTAGEAQELLTRIATTNDAAAAARDADLLSESIPEDPKPKATSLASSTPCAHLTPSSPPTALPSCLPSTPRPPVVRLGSARCTSTNRYGHPM